LQYLSKDDLASAYHDAQLSARKSWLKYDEFERLGNNEVRSDLPANMPKVNDGSLSAAIRKVPKRIIAQPLTGKIKATDRDENWVATLATIILENHIVPNANTDAPFLNKWQTALKNALIYGSQPIYTFFTQHGTYTGADMSLPYVRNVYLEPGKVSDMASDFIFMDSWYTKLQAKRLVDKAAQDAKEADASDDEEAYEGIWDAKELQAWYDAGPQGKDSQNMTAAERAGLNRNEKGLYKLITCFNRGYQAPFYTFAPTIADRVVGTQINSNPTGDVPIIYLYADEDMVNPYGTGMVQMAGATQNVLDNLTQTDVLETQIGGQPPIDIAGDRTTTNLKSMVYAPNAFWFTGDAKVTPVQAVNPAMYNAIPARINLYKSQLQYQTGTMDNTIPSQDGSTGMSKTPAGVHANQNMMNADDSFIQQRLGEAYERVIKSMVNIHMNNMEGTELLKVEGDDIELLATTDLVPTDPETGEPQADQIEVVWDNVRGTFEFQVDPKSGMQNNDREQAADLQEAIKEISLPVSYYMAQNGYKFNIGEAYHTLFTKLGVENIDKVITKMTPQEKQDAQDAPFPIIDPPQLRYALADLPPEAVQPALQNAGVTYQPIPGSMPWKDQAAMANAQVKAQDSEILSNRTAHDMAHKDVQAVSDATQQQVQNNQTDQKMQADQQAQTQSAPSSPASQQSTPAPAAPNGQPVPPQNGQQVAAQFSSPEQSPAAAPAQSPSMASNSPYYTQMSPYQAPGNPSTPPEKPSLQERLMEIQEQYKVDQETATTIAAAQDHGMTDDQLPKLFRMLAEHSKKSEPAQV
jgi:hypothetical protein